MLLPGPTPRRTANVDARLKSWAIRQATKTRWTGETNLIRTRTRPARQGDGGRGAAAGTMVRLGPVMISELTRSDIRTAKALKANEMDIDEVCTAPGRLSARSRLPRRFPT